MVGIFICLVQNVVNMDRKREKHLAGTQTQYQCCERDAPRCRSRCLESDRKFVLILGGAGARRVAFSTTIFIVKTYRNSAFPDNFIVIYITELSFRQPLFYIRVTSCHNRVSYLNCLIGKSQREDARITDMNMCISRD